jgi:hypothetical protein
MYDPRWDDVRERDDVHARVATIGIERLLWRRTSVAC